MPDRELFFVLIIVLCFMVLYAIAGLWCAIYVTGFQAGCQNVNKLGYICRNCESWNCTGCFYGRHQKYRGPWQA